MGGVLGRQTRGGVSKYCHLILFNQSSGYNNYYLLPPNIKSYFNPNDFFTHPHICPECDRFGYQELKVITANQRNNEPTPAATTPCYRRKSYGMTALFVGWLFYSACALGWFILEAPAGEHCTNNVY